MLSVADISRILGISNQAARGITQKPYELAVGVTHPATGGRPYLVFNPIDVISRLRHIGRMDDATKILTHIEEQVQ